MTLAESSSIYLATSVQRANLQVGNGSSSSGRGEITLEYHDFDDLLGCQSESSRQMVILRWKIYHNAYKNYMRRVFACAAPCERDMSDILQRLLIVDGVHLFILLLMCRWLGPIPRTWSLEPLLAKAGKQQKRSGRSLTEGDSWCEQSTLHWP